MSTNCPNCGSIVPEYTTWCPACGTDITGYTFEVSRKINERMEREFMEGINSFYDLGTYGGMPSNGGFVEANNEYEVGISRMAEALHCILGSIRKASTYDSWKRGIDVEVGHIREEMDIINRVMKEYSRSLYIKDREYGGVWREGRRSIKYMEKQAEELALKAARKKQQTLRLKDMSPPLKKLAIQTYETIRILAIRVKRNVEGRYNRPAENVFNDKQLIEEVKELNRIVDEVLEYI